MRVLPPGIADEECPPLRGAIVDKDRLLAVFILEVRAVLVWNCVIDARRLPAAT